MHHEYIGAHCLRFCPSEFNERDEATCRIYSATIDSLTATKRINTSIKVFGRIGSRTTFRLTIFPYLGYDRRYTPHVITIAVAFTLIRRTPDPLLWDVL